MTAPVHYYNMISTLLELGGLKDTTLMTIQNIETCLDKGITKWIKDVEEGEKAKLDGKQGEVSSSTLLEGLAHEAIQEFRKSIPRLQQYLRLKFPQQSAYKAIAYYNEGKIPGVGDYKPQPGERNLKGEVVTGGYDPSKDNYGLNFYGQFPSNRIAQLKPPVETGGDGDYYERNYFLETEWPSSIWGSVKAGTSGYVGETSPISAEVKGAWTLGLVPNYSTFPQTNAAGLPTAEISAGMVFLVIVNMYFFRAQNSTESLTISDAVDFVANVATRAEIAALKATTDPNDVLGQKKIQELEKTLEGGNIYEEGKSVSAEDIANSIMFTEQSMLIRNLESFARNYSALMDLRDKTGKPYEKTQIMQGNPSEMINKLTLKPGVSEFLDFTTDQISQLAPKFKIFQIVYDNKNNFKREVEFEFANKNNIDSAERNSILSSRGRESVGVRSFQWKYIGTNPVTARNDLTAKLEIYFQSFTDLFEERFGVDDDGKVFRYRYVDLILRNPHNEGESVENQSAAETEKTSRDKDLKPEKFETKVIVGWNFRETELARQVQKNNPNISDLSYFNEVLFMTLVDHEFSIEEDGTFTLSISYRARLDAMMQDKRSDVLANVDVMKQRAAREKQIEELEKDCDQSDQTRESLKKLKDDYDKTKTKWRQESYQSILNDLMGLGEDKVPKLYYVEVDAKKFLEAGRPVEKAEEFFIDPGSQGALLTTESIKEAISKTSSPDQVSPKKENYVDAATEGLEKGADKLKSFAGAEGTTGTYATEAVAKLSPMGVAEAALAVYGAYETNSIITSFEETGELDGEDINKYLLTTIPTGPSSSDNYRIHYMFFGDLVELLSKRVMDPVRQAEIGNLDTTLSGDQTENVRVLLGGMEFFPDKDSAGPIRCNLSALPISLLIFKKFMLKRVIAKKRDIYSLLDFMRDFIKFMLDEITGSNTKESGEVYKLNVEVKTAVLTMPGKDTPISKGGADPVREKFLEEQSKIIDKDHQSINKTTRLDLSKINETNTIVPYSDPESNKARKAYHYLTIYVENKTPTHLRGIEVLDRHAGIYHFNVGENRSIFKRASFKKTDATYLREARFAEENYNPLATLANVYDVDMELFGNTIFYPGQYLFINPFGLGAGLGFPWDRNSYSNIMGLGGYHLVTGVESVMDSDGFTTNVTARFETTGDGRSKEDKRTDTKSPKCEPQEATEIK